MPHLISGHRANLSSQGLGEGRVEEVLGSLDAQGYDLPIEFVVLFFQAPVILGTWSRCWGEGWGIGPLSQQGWG